MHGLLFLSFFILVYYMINAKQETKPYEETIHIQDKRGQKKAKARGVGFEPTRPFDHRLSRPAPYQARATPQLCPNYFFAIVFLFSA